MGASLTLDTTQFEDAMRLYSTATRKTMADSANRFLNNVAIKGLDVAKRAQSGEIETLPARPWWLKFLAKMAGARRLARDTARYQKRVSRFEDRKAKGLRTRAPKMTRQHGTREQWIRDMQRAEDGVLKTRMSHVNFLRLFFLRMSREVKNKIGGGLSASLPPRADGGFSVLFQDATVANPSAYIRVTYDYRKRSSDTAAGTEALLQPAIDEAAQIALADVVEYAKGRMIEDAAARMAVGRVA